jgi:DNA-directed RNA polymerase-4 subunit 1
LHPYGFSFKLGGFEYVNSCNIENINCKCKLHVISKEELITQRNGHLSNVWKENQVEIGGIVYMVMQGGDLILINRPPLVHQHSLIAISFKCARWSKFCVFNT